VSKERYRRIVNDGHVLAMHAYKHQYKKIYKSLEDFDKDFTKLSKLLYDTTGYKPNLYRFPGGSYNKVSKVKIEDLIHYLNEKEMIYYDWNVLNGDATGIDYTKEQMIDNVLNGVAVKKTSIVLMHDDKNKSKTADMLPELLDALISGGAKVLPMDDTVPLIQQVKVNSVK
jgi:peptidoglycan/xylan/chitin deacetylase (PgdA/CDA1 family)